jgi:hypothetical protein
MKKLISLVTFFLCISIGATSQNTTFNNVSIGTDAPGYGVKIKANFPGVSGGWARAFSISNETGDKTYITLGSFGGLTNGVSSINNSYIGTDWNNQYMTFLPSGNIGIGTTNPASKLTVAGNIASREVKVSVDAGADFVFENNYDLPSLESVDKFIKENKHLPEIASAKEMQKDGINLSEMNIKLLQKIEELTLYVIEMKKESEKQNDKILALEKKLKN